MGRSARPGGATPRTPERYFYPDQYSNDANWRAHYETTGPEIWAQTERTGDALRRPDSARAAPSWAPAQRCASTTRKSA